MGIQTTIYNTLFRRTSTFALAICASAFFFERTFELGSEAFYKNYNKGKLFEDIKREE